MELQSPARLDPHRVLVVEPFYGGSHQAFLDAVVQHSRHDFTLVTGAAKVWKWRMRSAPLQMAGAIVQAVRSDGVPDVVMCSDMLDLPSTLGVLASNQRGATDSSLLAELLRVPIVTYFHENQWTYPQSPHARVDHHFGYTNLLTALISDACWFNSHFHLTEFLQASRQFIEKMPDSRDVHDLDGLQRKCQVIPPGFIDPNQTAPARPVRTSESPLRIGWVSRWEYDKRPDRFLDLLRKLDQHEIDFQLILLGHRSGNKRDLNAVRDQFGSRIRVDEYSESVTAYRERLREIDVVVSTADHEFFGIAICESVAAGAAPVLPNRLSYPELFPTIRQYDTIEDAVNLIASFRDEPMRLATCKTAQESIASLRVESITETLDNAIGDVVMKRSR